MPEVMEADAAEAGLAEERGEGTGEVGRSIDPSCAGVNTCSPCCHAVPAALRSLLLFVVELQRLDTAGGEGDAALGGPGLGGRRGESAPAGALHGAAGGGSTSVEVEVVPVRAEEFALAESGVKREFEQRVQPVTVHDGEELAGFVGGEGSEAPWQVVRRWLSQVWTSFAVGLVSFFLPSPGMR
ncbi:hypothetical protein ADL22_05630 [Streptomyces sp. NRRL F-4489]|nr:hypothetical protein ADL22_05630 [Streptomyces sp. NRRL F-4489]